jgi:hypothetical protein
MGQTATSPSHAASLRVNGPDEPADQKIMLDDLDAVRRDDELIDRIARGEEPGPGDELQLLLRDVRAVWRDWLFRKDEIR